MRTSSMQKPVLTAIVAVAICALTVLGCGGGSSSDDQTGGGDGGSKTAASGETNSVPIARKFVKQANAVCVKLEAEIQAEIGSSLTSNGIKQIGEGESP